MGPKCTWRRNMNRVTVIVKLPKTRNPYHDSLRILGTKKVKARKGKGSYSRKINQARQIAGLSFYRIGCSQSVLAV